MVKLKGKLTGLQEKTFEKEGKKHLYWIMTLGEFFPINVTVWDADLLKEIQIDDWLSVEYEVKGNFKNALKIEKTEADTKKAFNGVNTEPVIIEEQVEDDFKEYEGGYSGGVTDFNKAFIVNIKGKKFVRFNGLLDKAHEKGFKTFEITQMSVSTDGKSAWCLGYVEMKDGLKVYMTGSANPETLGTHLRGYAVEMAGTRCFARALRNALNVDFVSVEEMK